MSSKKSKTKVSQAELRKLMQQMKAKKVGSDTTRNISKPGFNNGTTAKRTLEREVCEVSNKKIKTAQISKHSKDVKTNKNGKSFKNRDKIDERFMETNSSQISTTIQNVRQPSTSLVGGMYGDSGSSDEDVGGVAGRLAPPSGDGASSSTSLPPPSGKQNGEKPMKSSLPEGFFDNPEVDAKMRGVETPTDKLDREWESFKKEMNQAEDQSEALIDEEQVGGHLDREIEEIDHQIQLYNLVDKLNDKKESAIHMTHHKDVKMEEESSSSDEDDVLLNWREKDAFT